MAEAMIQALLRAGEVTPEQIIASGPRPERGAKLRDRHGVRVSADNVATASEADIVILSVKPQVLPPVLAELRGHIQPTAIVLSIVAGMPMAAIRAGLDHAAVVRTMPNTPAQIGEGMTVWTAASAVTEPQRAQARAILRTMGPEMHVTHEDALNMATAVSGTGPTYVFLLMEALVDAAVHLGFSRRQARCWSSRRCSAPPGSLRSPTSTWRSYGTRSLPLAAPAPRRSTSWRRGDCVRYCPRPSGQPTGNRACWANESSSPWRVR